MSKFKEYRENRQVRINKAPAFSKYIGLDHRFKIHSHNAAERPVCTYHVKGRESGAQPRQR